MKYIIEFYPYRWNELRLTKGEVGTNQPISMHHSTDKHLTFIRQINVQSLKRQQYIQLNLW